LLDSLTQLAQRRISLVRDFDSDSLGIALQGSCASTGMWQSRTTAGLSPTLPELLDRRQTDAKLFRHFKLGLLIGFQSRDNSFT